MTPTNLQTFAQRLHHHRTRNPNACVLLGVDRLLDQLPDPSLDFAADLHREAGALLDDLDRLHPGDDFDERLDADLARLILERERHDLSCTFNGRTDLQQHPSAGEDIGDGIFLIFLRDDLPLHERLAFITGRVEQVPRYLDALTARLDTPVARWVAVDLERTEGLSDLFQNVLQAARTSAFPDAARLERAADAANAALASYRERLASAPTTPDLHLGDATTRQLLRLRGIELTPEQLHAVAADFIRRNDADLDELRGRLNARYGLPADTTTAQLHQHLIRHFRAPAEDLSEILDLYRAEHTRLLRFIAERDLFPVFAEQELKIIRTPSFLEATIPAGAMSPPPPFLPGTRTSIIYLTLSEELRDEHTLVGIPNMMIHEGVPGHHLQLATATNHPSIVRNHIDAPDLAEGWTTMLEDYMLDLGYMEHLTDEARFFGKREIARLGARVGIDLFFMTGERGYLELGTDADVHQPDPFRAAGDLLRTLTGFVPGRVEAELNWYSHNRAYPLSYLTGNHLVWQLKRDVQEAQRGRLDGLDLDRAFHRTFLHAGNMPLSALRRVFAHQGLLA